MFAHLSPDQDIIAGLYLSAIVCLSLRSSTIRLVLQNMSGMVSFHSLCVLLDLVYCIFLWSDLLKRQMVQVKASIPHGGIESQ